MRNKKIVAIRKFYFLEYFDILLKSFEYSTIPETAIDMFIVLKDKKQLGESKYKKNHNTTDYSSIHTIKHLTYTFDEVLSESLDLKLVEKKGKEINISPLGNKLLGISKTKGLDKFNLEIFKLMEQKTNGFRYLIESCYNGNPTKNGLLAFPVYSPLKLGISKDEIVYNKNGLNNYFKVLQEKLESDIKIYLGIDLNIENANKSLAKRINTSGLIDNYNYSTSIFANYNKIIKRTRDYWINYFLKEIYKFDLSLSYFELWVYRSKQLGIINTHEFYPGFNGKIVYPISVLMDEKANTDFKELYSYEDGAKLYFHAPKWSSNQNEFVDILFRSYHDIKARTKSYFISLHDLRDMVCFKMKIAEKAFDEFLRKAYQLNLKNQLKIKISLETDKLPEENKAIYLMREPVLISGKPKNIIAIELKK
ncbi:MAG: hypothetical protein SFY56_10825 [Bacteroidota bacterium]|nr:hypothetical protein [Bacteroidota bacterium]